MNHLINEKSPYLLQHVNNPVNWHPWGKEAFAKANAQNKPIFLSIGYSTCHWCHVMAHESFEDHEVADYLNRHFISVKVDREERPDIDNVYMTVCQMFTGSGGWPLTILMTPEQIPFWAGTYLPKYTRSGHVGLMELLPTINKIWNENQESILSAGEELVKELKKGINGISHPATPDKEITQLGFRQFKKTYDSVYGGFGSAPKFPTPHNLMFLLYFAVIEQNASAQNMAEHTLEQMYRGGIFDHIGGGFSRYSTDEKWLIPHFEKMLYDNALLSYTYLEAYRFTGRSLYKRVAKKTLDYVSNELTHKNGGFFASQDADSEGIEGKYYVFTQKELQSALGVSNYKIFSDWFHITPKGNFEGKNIPNLIQNSNFEEENPTIDQIVKKLYDYRKSRTLLHKDDKILTSWNALMIASFAKASRVLNDLGYLNKAKQAEEFISSKLTDSSGGLFLRYRDGETAIAGQIDDYAFYAYSLLELYHATFDTIYLEKCIFITEKMVELFWDKEESGFYLYAYNAEQLISRPKEVYDGAIPSGNSVAGIVLSQLSRLTGEEKWRALSYDQISFLSGAIKEYPAAFSMSLIALLEALSPSRELVCVSSKDALPEELFTFLDSPASVNLTVLFKTPENQARLEQLAPFTGQYPIPEDGCLYYLCENGACQAPVSDLLHLHLTPTF